MCFTHCYFGGKRPAELVIPVRQRLSGRLAHLAPFGSGEHLAEDGYQLLRGRLRLEWCGERLGMDLAGPTEQGIDGRFPPAGTDAG